MKTTVNLQDLLSYSMLPIYIAAGVIVLLVLCLVIIHIVRRPKKTRDNNIFVPRSIAAIKKKYLSRLAKLMESVESNSIEIRIAYQKLSKIIRMFIYEATGIKVQNYTLAEIREQNMTVLAELVEEYYPPEFAKMSVGNIVESLAKTKKVIEEWN